MSFDFEGMVFRIVTEDGEQKLTLKEYHTKDDLMEKVGLSAIQPKDRRTLFLGTTILSYPFWYLEQNKKASDAFNELERLRLACPIKYFVPQSEAALMFLNDQEHDLKMMVAGNGYGKTTLAILDMLLDICPTDPSWPIFTVHGVKHRSYRGPLTTGGVSITSYEWANLQQTIHPQVLMRWTPLEGLGDYAPGGKAVVNWKNCPRLFIYDTPVNYHACSQAQTVFESGAWDIAVWDEQGEEAKFDAANRAVRRRHGRHIFSLTPHKVEGRPDTGAGTWIQKLFTGEQTSGCNVKAYTADIFSLPDWVYSEKAKKNAYREWVEEPTANNHLSKLREGRARLYGEFHVAGGLVFDEWNPEYHLIDQFEIPDDWTKLRFIDHGRKEPTAALLVAINPDGDMFAYDEYYERDKNVYQNAVDIIKWCGNEREKIETYIDDRGINVERYREIFTKQRFFRTFLDGHSYGSPGDEGKFTIGEIYKRAGIVPLAPADGQGTEFQASVASELFRIDFDREHRVTKKKGAPRLYVFKTLRWFIWEIQQYVNCEVLRRDRQTKRSYVGEKPRPVNDHLMSCVLFLAMCEPRYIPGAGELERRSRDSDSRDENVQTIARDSYTRY